MKAASHEFDEATSTQSVETDQPVTRTILSAVRPIPTPAILSVARPATEPIELPSNDAHTHHECSEMESLIATDTAQEIAIWLELNGWPGSEDAQRWYRARVPKGAFA